MSNSSRPHGLQPTRLLRAWDFPGKSTGVGCHFILQCMKVKSEGEVAQSCPTLRDPMDCSPPGSSVHGIFQARVLEWVAIAFSGLCFYVWAFSSCLQQWPDSRCCAQASHYSDFSCCRAQSLKCADFSSCGIRT